MLASLRAAYPAAVIHWLVQDSFVDVARGHPALGDPARPGESGVVPFARGGFGVAAFLRLARRLRGEEYNLVVDAQGLARSALLARITGARVRVGHADAREGAWALYTKRVEEGRSRHTVDRMLTLVEALGVKGLRDAGAMRLYVPRDVTRPAAAPPLGTRYVVLAPTSRWAGKQWPDARFAEVARRICSGGVPVVLVGGKGERGQIPRTLAAARECVGGGGVIDLVGSTTLGELMGVIEHAGVVVANDSAALHIAVGLERRVVALFGPTRVELVGPYGRAGEVVQHVTSRDDMRHKRVEAAGLMGRIGVGEVMERVGRVV